METKAGKSVNGNRSLSCFAISVALTTGIIIIIVLGRAAIISTGLPLYVLAVGVVIAGLVFGIRAARRAEEKFRYQFGLVFNGIMLFALMMMLVIFFFVRAQGPGMM